VHSREESVETKLQRIADKAKREPGFKFSSLFHLMNEELLLGCFERLRNNAASGIDEVTKEQYAEKLEGNVQQLVTRLHRMAYIPQARFCEGCALQAHEVQQSEMTAPAKPSQQPGTESCVVFNNDHCEALTGRGQARTSVSGKIAPKSNVVEVADLVSQWGRQKLGMHYGELIKMLPGFVPLACHQRTSCEQGRATGFRRSL